MIKIVFVSFLLIWPTLCFADWQSVLNSSFDIAETFDNAADWGSGIAGDAGTKRTSGIPSDTIIDAFRFAPSDAGNMDGNAIADHGIANRITGKSLKIGYDWKNVGVHGIDIQTTSGADNGYTDLYLFVRAKFPSGFLPTDGAGHYYNFTAFKIAYAMMGWESVTQYGPTGFKASCANGNVGDFYALNWSMVNIYPVTHTGPLDKYYKLVVGAANPQSACVNYTWIDMDTQGGLSFDNFSANGEVSNTWGVHDFNTGVELVDTWLGIEWHFKSSTADTADGEIEVWIYDFEGNIISSGSITGLITRKTCECSSVTYFDDEMTKYNQVAIGANRLNGWGAYTSCGGTPCIDKDEGYQEFADDSVVNHFYYIDDIIIDDAGIGATYFNLINPSSVLTGTAITGGVTETEIVTGGQTIIITLANDTWNANVGSDSAETTALIAGLDSDKAEATGWDALIKTDLDHTDITRDSDTQVTITLPAYAAYNIATNETITVTIPATCVASAQEIVATPTVLVSVIAPVVGGGGAGMTYSSSGKTVSYNSNGYNIVQ